MSFEIKDEHDLINMIIARCDGCIEGEGCLHKYESDGCESLKSLIKDYEERKESLKHASDKVLEFLRSEKPDSEPVDMDDMKKRVQTNLLIARQEMHDTNTLTVNAMVCIVDALFYLVQNIDEPRQQEIRFEIPENMSVMSVKDIMRRGQIVGVDMGDPNGDRTVNIGVCNVTGNYCSMCTPGPCEHRKV